MITARDKFCPVVTNLKHENVLIVHLVPAFYILIVVDLMK